MRSILWLAAAVLAGAQTAPELASKVALDHGVTLAADYLVHSVPAEGGTLVANDYLVVDAALTGPKNVLSVSIGQFRLRINGKTTLGTEPAGMVVNSLTRPEYSNHPVIDASAGPVVISSRPSAGRFPGDTSQHPPRVPRTSDPEAKEAEVPVDQRIQRAALPEGDVTLPVRGLLFFPFLGKTKSIKSLELLYEGPAGKASLRLLPASY